MPCHPCHHPSQALRELAKTRQVLIFDNPLVGLSGGRRAMLLANLPPLAAAQCSLPSRRSALMSRSLAAVLYLAADTLASQRRLNLTIPFMAASTVELIAALNLPRKPDVLGWGGRACVLFAVGWGPDRRLTQWQPARVQLPTPQ